MLNSAQSTNAVITFNLQVLAIFSSTLYFSLTQCSAMISFYWLFQFQELPCTNVCYLIPAYPWTYQAPLYSSPSFNQYNLVSKIMFVISHLLLFSFYSTQQWFLFNGSSGIRYEHLPMLAISHLQLLSLNSAV